MRSRIAGTGSFTPDRVVSNEELAGLLDTTADWIENRSGIAERRWVTGRTTTSDLAYEAAVRAMVDAAATADDLDMILLATISPDHDFPGTACFLQDKLGAPGIPAIDVRQQCSGFMYALSMADLYIRTGQAATVLVLGAEIHSKGLDISPEGRDISILFGDGAGAFVLRAVDDPSDQDSQIYSTHIHSDGSGAKALWAEAPGQARPGHRITVDDIEAGRHFPVMDGRRIFMNAVKRMPESIHEALDANGAKLDEVDWFFFHQANLRINEAVARRLEIDGSRVFNTIQRFGNTTAATIPLGMDTAIRENRLVRGQLVALSTFGAGYTWGSSLIRF